jgi:ribosomal protein S18 acetylase RimI-like enzyme
MRPVLPRKFYAHLAVGTARTLAATHHVEPQGLHERMLVNDWAPLEKIDASHAVPLGPPDAREGGVLASVSGVHVVSRSHRVAALGNVATRSELRGRGLARIAVAATCQALRPHVDHLGLNVDAANAEGIRLYEGLGFTRVASYEEVRIG